ncbi:MAG: type III toxin-antitoxin system ToxN/AbiQ family toxin, partial [Lachnospiraceae bacterium]|nr:type III toxin-antitoxin system ToxN/AbiQ family toxin [Lachnospiraceae bacterium]
PKALKCGTIKEALASYFFWGVHMNFDKVQFVYIDVDYMEYLNGIDSEVFFNKKDQNYRLKPHLGILLNNAGLKYVIPLTSAKEKHKGWADVTADWYRIYEIIDIKRDPVDRDDIIVEVKNQEILKKIKPEDQKNVRQRILSVLDMRKMFPVNDTVYTEVKFNISSNASRSDTQRTFLMIKEYNFLNEIADDIAKKTTKIYEKQIRKNKVLPYHCDYRKLEQALEKYKEEEK